MECALAIIEKTLDLLKKGKVEQAIEILESMKTIYPIVCGYLVEDINRYFEVNCDA